MLPIFESFYCNCFEWTNISGCFINIYFSLALPKCTIFNISIILHHAAFKPLSRLPSSIITEILQQTETWAIISISNIQSEMFIFWYAVPNLLDKKKNKKKIFHVTLLFLPTKPGEVFIFWRESIIERKPNTA